MRLPSAAAGLLIVLSLLVMACNALPGTSGAGSTPTPSESSERSPAATATPAADPTPYPTPPPDTPEEIKAIWEAWTTLVDDHVARRDIALNDLKQVAIEAMVAEVDDPYTSYLPPEQYQLESRSFSGSFTGIGAEVRMDEGRLTIMSPLPDTPAERAGLEPGDVILKVDGTSTEGMTIREAVLRIRGPEGEPVKLLVKPADGSEPRQVSVVRDVIELTSVSATVLDSGIGYARLDSFSKNTGESLRSELEHMQDSGIHGLVLDLRNNPGGLVSETVDIAGYFLNGGLVMYEVDGKGNRTDLEANGKPIMPDLPLAVLVNRFSASGSEVLAGALQDRGRARLVGEQTFGKGSVNLLRGLSDGGGLYFTFAHWYTPDGRLIEGAGLEPDVRVEGDPTFHVVESDEDAQAQLVREDPQLAKAVDLLEDEATTTAVR